ncbi:TonB-dependent copper receptor [Thiocystis minor]|uniref:TonB-dependent copper receptor n=1 Tax=Thiocystis minor TaxID=61597 RepID=UPI001F5CFE0D|nr:TonB-dependent copper receptor [Thiocystis minor]
MTAAAGESMDPPADPLAESVLPEVVVTGTRSTLLPPATFSSPIQGLPVGLPADGGDLLRHLPGVSGARMGGHGIDPIVRGQSQNQLNVLIDGAYAFGGCPNRMDPPTTLLDLDAFDRLTLIKSAQTVRYGGGGSGGTILFERETPRFSAGEAPRVRLNGGLTSNSEAQSAGADIAFGNPLGFARVTGQSRSADNYRDGNGDEVRSAFNSDAAGVTLGLTPNDGTRLELKYDRTHNWDVLFAGSAMDSPYSDSDQWRLTFDQDVVLGPLHALHAAFYSVNVDHLMDNYSLRTQTSPFRMRVPTESDTTGGRVVADLTSGATDWTLGVDSLKVARDATRYWNFRSTSVDVPQSFLWPDVEQDALGLFAEAEHPLSEVARLTAGLRYDRVRASLSRSRANAAPVGPAWVLSPSQLYAAYYGRAAEDRAEHNLGGFLRYARDLRPGLELTAGLSRSVRTADATEAYVASNGNPASARWIGNPGIRPERHHQIDLTLTRTATTWRTGLEVFYDRVSDYILRDRAHGQSGILLSDNASIYRNVEAELAGGEWTGEIRLGAHWEAGASLAYVSAQNRTDGRAIAQIPPLNGHLSLEHRRESWSGGARLNWSDTQHRVDDDPLIGSGLDVGETPGWWTLDLYGEASLGQHGRLRLGIDNLFDRAYADHVNRANLDPFNPGAVQVNEPGRVLWARVSVDF